MDKELVLFDKDNKEISWYDPVIPEEVKETPGFLFLNVGGYGYSIPKEKYHHYVIRDMEEER